MDGRKNVSPLLFQVGDEYSWSNKANDFRFEMINFIPPPLPHPPLPTNTTRRELVVNEKTKVSKAFLPGDEISRNEEKALW